ncbi:MAG: esterase [Betaproteobacteria bacterium]|nr:esterase [Betaproteobacteria bacterium]
MTAPAFEGIELLPAAGPVAQLFILLHGVGGRASDLLPLADALGTAFPQAACLLPEGPSPFDEAAEGRQWFSIDGITEGNRPARVAEALPALHALVRQAQARHKVVQPDTALAGFSQGAIMALEYAVAHDGSVGRVLAFAGRFATLPERAPEFTTLHLLHGKADRIVPVDHAYAAYERLSRLGGDATLDVADSVGHELHAALADRAIHRLRTCIPLRTWKNALGGAPT